MSTNDPTANGADAPAGPLPPVPPDLLAQIGLPETWRPEPARWGWLKLNGRGGQTLHILVFHTSVGAFGVAFAGNQMADFVKQATEQHSGIIIATPGSPS